MDLTRVLRKHEPHSSGWYSRGYLPHFDGRPVPQFITLHLFDSVPRAVIERWQTQLHQLAEPEQLLVLRNRIEKYLDMGYGGCFLRESKIATIVQAALLAFDQLRYNLFAWVVMPNHTHSLLSRYEGYDLEGLIHSHKSYTAHEANRILNRSGRFWMKEYFDRYIRNADHFRNTVRYIEDNPVKAGLCSKPSDWPFSSAWFREHQDAIK